MTDINPNGALPPAQRALHEIAHGSENVIALSTLAVSEVLLPVPAADEFPEGVGGAELPREIQLPVYEQDDGRQRWSRCSPPRPGWPTRCPRPGATGWSSWPR